MYFSFIFYDGVTVLYDSAAPPSNRCHLYALGCRELWCRPLRTLLAAGLTTKASHRAEAATATDHFIIRRFSRALYRPVTLLFQNFS